MATIGDFIEFMRDNLDPGDEITKELAADFFSDFMLQWEEDQ